MKTYLSIFLLLFFAAFCKDASAQSIDTSTKGVLRVDSRVPSPVLLYRIQIATVNSKTKIGPLLKHYEITEEPFLENENTTAVKVLIGNYPKYSSAESRANELKRKGLKSAFVVPYYKGTRISLQEAASHTQE